MDSSEKGQKNYREAGKRERGRRGAGIDAGHAFGTFSR